MRSALNHLIGAMSHDAANSPGFNAAKLSGDRLALMKAKAEKAMNSTLLLLFSLSLLLTAVLACSRLAAFPPKFTGTPYEGAVATPDGDRMLERGRWANKHREPAPKDSGSTGNFGPGWPTMAELDKELGGPDGFFTLCGLHYCNLFANPRMHVLFDTRDPDTAVSAMDHGKRIAATIMDGTLNTRYFASLGRGFSGAFAVMGTHAKAKKCPMRPTSQQVALPKGHRKANQRFTTDQRDSWVGSHMSAAAECGASEEFQQKYGLWLAMLVSAYAPFVDERTGQLDWMEESKYG